MDDSLSQRALVKVCMMSKCSRNETTILIDSTTLIMMCQQLRTVLDSSKELGCWQSYFSTAGEYFDHVLGPG